MDSITKNEIQSAIKNFLITTSNTKNKENDLGKAIESGNESNIQKIQKEIHNKKIKCELNTWMNYASNKLLNNSFQLGNYINKGVNTKASGNVIFFNKTIELDEYLVSSQTVSDKLEMDGTGSAADLSIFKFFNIELGAIKKYKLYELIKLDHPSLTGCFADNEEQSQKNQQIFKQALSCVANFSKTSDANKQLIFPNSSKSIENNQYSCVVPLHPSSLINIFYNKVKKCDNERYEMLKNKNSEKDNYSYFIDLALVKIGGSQPQNVSGLTNMQSGVNFLLSSMPPMVKQKEKYTLNKKQHSIFDRKLEYYCSENLKELVSILKSDCYSDSVKKEKQKEALYLILNDILFVAKQIQNELNVGWSKEYELSFSEKYWLDPNRSKMSCENVFKEKYENMEWIDEIVKKFADWLNFILRNKIKQSSSNFNDNTHIEWSKEMHNIIKESQRNKERIF